MCGLLALLSVAARAESTAFAVGQEWTYWARADEPDSRVVILRIDEATFGKRIVHVAVVGLRWKHSAKDPVGEEWRMGHTAFAEDALRESVRELKVTRPAAQLPDFAESYAKWEKFGPVGKRPCWTISVLRAVEAQVTQIKRQRGL